MGSSYCSVDEGQGPPVQVMMGCCSGDEGQGALGGVSSRTEAREGRGG